jgi:hypothetical protein
LQVAGNNEAWVTSTFKTLDDRINIARNARSILHAPGSYLTGLVFVVFPTLIFIIDQTYRNHQVYIDSFGIIIKLGGMAYAFLFGTLIYRWLFNYGLWAFPSVELINERDVSARHRKFLFSVVTSFLVGAISYYLYKR